MEYIKAKDAKGREVFINGRIVDVSDVEQSDTVPTNVLLHHDGGIYECPQTEQLETYTM
jgi:hypothetical protein